jgi:hypothetical protein
MITLTAVSKSYGNNGHYIARVTGRNSKYTFEREFIGRMDGREKHAYIDEPGLYEICDIDKKGRKDQNYRIIVPDPSGELICLRPYGDNLDGVGAMEIATEVAKRIEAGEQIAGMIQLEKKPDSEDWGYRLLSKAAAKKAHVSATIDSAIEACWEVLQALPEKEAKKALAALKARVSPPKAATVAPEADQPAEPASTEE